MNIISPAILQYAKLRADGLTHHIKEPLEAQREVFQHLISQAQHTVFGREYRFNHIFRPAEFRSAVPIHEYEDLKPFIERMMQGEENVLWNTPVQWFAKSSGTTSDRSKFIPVSDESLDENHYQANKDLLYLYHLSYPECQLLNGKGLVIGGSHQVAELSKDIQYGDLSAVLLQNAPFYGQWLKTPQLAIALMDNWENKIEALAQSTIQEDVTSVSGVPTWTQVLFKRILEITGKENIKQVWPNLELYFHGGVSFSPYRAAFEKLVGEPIHYLEIYNASEGFFAAQTHEDEVGMLLFLEHGIYYEFLPVDEYGKENPKTIGLDQVETGKNYAPVISTVGGLWRYLIGDTIAFTSVYPFRIKVTGRLKHYINAFGEEVIIDNADRAIAEASRLTGAIVRDYSAAPVYFSDNSNGAHEWLIEFEKLPVDPEKFADALDEHLRMVNSDYDAKRYKDIALRRLIMHVVPDGGFSDWLRSKGKLGGQHKVPRLSNDRKIIEEIKAHLNIK